MGPDIKLVQRHVAWASIAPTTLRNMSVGGKRGRICGYLTKLPLEQITSGPDKFQNCLNSWTDELVRTCHINFGPARKAINLFLRDACYNNYLRERYHLQHIEELLEVPLDGIVMSALKTLCPGFGLVTVPVVKLGRTSSARFQEAANALAAFNDTKRVHLDLWLWKSAEGGSNLRTL